MAREADKDSINYKLGQELYRQLSHHMNNSIGQIDFNQGFFDALVQDHRTLQQAYGRFAFSILIKYSKLEYGTHTDPRNVHFLESCKEIAPKLEHNYLPYI